MTALRHGFIRFEDYEGQWVDDSTTTTVYFGGQKISGPSGERPGAVAYLLLLELLPPPIETKKEKEQT